MEDRGEDQGLCCICKEAVTDIHAEVGQGMVVSVCKKCLESARENFIWVCMHCGSAYIRPKALVLKRLRNSELLRAYKACEGLQIIQGIDVCVECDPGFVMEYVAAAQAGSREGRC